MLLTGAALAVLVSGPAAAAPAWMNARLSPDQRADLLLDRMSLAEEVSLLSGDIPGLMKARPAGVPTSAGYLAGIPDLDIPPLFESDASLGVANAGRKNDDATALPSGLAIAATWSPELAYAGGAMIAKEARQKGFNVLLSGGVNLVRDPRGGRSFEYLGEDPLLAGMVDGAAVRGVQSQGVISTVKHFALNDQEVGRMSLDARIDEAAFRESDLLAFEIAIDEGHPGSVMCAYNRINGAYGCDNPHLLNDVLKHDWGWPGWVMSDWGAVHATSAATHGLDQESGKQLDKLVDGHVWFEAPLTEAVASGEISKGRIRDMAHRVLRSMFAEGLFDHPASKGALDTAADAPVSQRVAEAALVLLKDDGALLPLSTAQRIAVIGGHADIGVISGSGSSQVIPLGSTRLAPPKGAPPWVQGVFFHPSSPLKAIREQAGGAQVDFLDGTDPAAAATLAKSADVAIVFATQWSTEGADVSLNLPGGQDALISAVAAANPHTIVVLETGGPVLMPWLGQVGAVVEAWYPGSRGGEAIGRLLFGRIEPSGRLPVSFPASESQLPRPELPGAHPAGGSLLAGPDRQPLTVDYSEGSDVGYRWYNHMGARPLFPFGGGLTYTRFAYRDLRVAGGRTLTASFVVTNMGKRAGLETAQVYLTSEPSRRQERLIGWSRVSLEPGQSRRVTVTAPRRLIADWDSAAGDWRIEGGSYHVAAGPDATTAALSGVAAVRSGRLRP